MNLEVLNNTSYENINVVCNGKSAVLQVGEVERFVVENKFQLEICVIEKNMVILNLFDAFLDGFISSESVINSINCNAKFNLEISSTSDVETIIVEDMEARDDIEHCLYNSIFLKNQNLSIVDSIYYLKDAEKEKRKSYFYQSVICSWTPVLLFCLIMAVLLEDIIILVPFFVILFIFSIPSWKKTAKIKTYYSNDNAHKQLKKEETVLIEKERYPESIESPESTKNKVLKIIKNFFGA